MKSNFPFRPQMQKVFWRDVSKDVHKISPELAKIIDEIDPGKDYPLYKASYPYGSLIVKEGVCFYPNQDGKLVTLEDESLPADVKKALGYAESMFPAGIVLQNSIELSIPTTKRIILFKNLFTSGYIFALWGELEKHSSFHPHQLFDITSGARSIFFLPRISDAFRHRRLCQEFDFRLPPPTDLLSQWEVFKTIVKHPEAKCDWHSTLFYFSGKWLEKIRSDDKKWLLLSRYLFRFSWQNTSFLRNKILYDFVFSRIQETRNLRPNPYVADMVKHLFMMGIGALPGFAPALDNIGAPVNILQKIFLEVYRLDSHYAPTILHPHWFSPEKPSSPIYYSLVMPTSLEFSPRCRKDHYALVDLRELAHLSKIYLEEIPKDYLKISNTLFAEIVNKIKFDYYHDGFDRDKFAQLTSMMPLSDPTLIYCPAGFDNKAFPVKAPFVRGCVKISLKE